MAKTSDADSTLTWYLHEATHSGPLMRQQPTETDRNVNPLYPVQAINPSQMRERKNPATSDPETPADIERSCRSYTETICSIQLKPTPMQPVQSTAPKEVAVAVDNAGCLGQLTSGTKQVVEDLRTMLLSQNLSLC